MTQDYSTADRIATYCVKVMMAVMTLTTVHEMRAAAAE